MPPGRCAQCKAVVAPSKLLASTIHTCGRCGQVLCRQCALCFKTHAACLEADAASHRSHLQAANPTVQPSNVRGDRL
jgi:hypothetical protein